MNTYLKTSTEFLNKNGYLLRDQVQHLVQFYKELSAMNLAPHENNDKKNYNTIEEIDIPYSFITSFMGLYKRKP